VTCLEFTGAEISVARDIRSRASSLVFDILRLCITMDRDGPVKEDWLAVFLYDLVFIARTRVIFSRFQPLHTYWLVAKLLLGALANPLCEPLVAFYATLERLHAKLSPYCSSPIS
jgi:hypothetical protein